jgi:hypothetical protein
MSLNAVFESRLADPRNDAMITNLDAIVVAHEARPPSLTVQQERLIAMFRTLSGRQGNDEVGIVIDRPTAELTAHHDTTIEPLVEFAKGGVVADIGPGMSDFLDNFHGHAETVAVDLTPDNVQFHVDQGHKGVWADASDMADVETGSVRLLHAAFSAPFWSPSVKEARAAASEYIRVLEPGGIALVGSVARRHYNEHYEYVVEATRCGIRTLPWPDPDEAHVSYISMSFCAELIERRNHADTTGQTSVELVGSRYISPGRMDYRRSAYASHVPNFLMIRKAA